MILDRLAHRLNEVQRGWETGGLRLAGHQLMRRASSDLYGAVRRFQAHLRSKNGFVLRDIHDYKMWLPLNDPGLSRELIRNGTREPALTRLMHEELERGMVGVDIGANLGYYALMEARLVGSEGKVFAIEPVSHNVNILRRNVETNGFTNIEVFSLAISDTPGIAEFSLAAESNLGCMLDARDSALSEGIRSRVLAGRRIHVPAVTLDEFLAEHGVCTVNFVRMDIEGLELKVTEGMTRTFQQSTGPLKLFIEVHNAHFQNAGVLVEPWLNELLSFGFRPGALASSGRLWRNLRAAEFVKRVCADEHCPHVLLIKDQ